MDPLIYVLYANAGTPPGRDMAGICKQALYLFFGHAKSIVLYA